MVRNLVIFGTRPEAIKMAPLINAFKNKEGYETKVCVTAQHREMLDQVLEFFDIIPDYDLDLMRPNQSLYTLTASIITELQVVLEDFTPDFVYVHGDTTTSMAASLASFYAGARVCHVEAGLRTFDKRSPFPEELNRQLTSKVADLHFAPTPLAKDNLLREGINPDSIFVTGNTVIDALLYSVDRVQSFSNDDIDVLEPILDSEKKIILVTGHRRENHGKGFLNICSALKEIANTHNNVQIIYPVHLNPNVQKPVYELLSGLDNIKLIAPLSYPAFVWLMNKSYLIITDSGGIQEEAPSLGKPVLVMRDTTERPEAVKTGTVLLVGTDTDKIILEASKLLLDSAYYKQMSSLENPYGDGSSSEKIIDIIKRYRN
ncbi:non-hydrolyzing UDP-N-acetylglucosamine 2-epimerase [Sphingobacterium kitahiroshimense]|uniref:non-hydrolyzing UDP-N-acetylglucosamine 2-epimerase n=1 Tax=Sphingobacterium kitahiroshimense TaxID=470446 RepID=UPI00320B2E77